MELELKLSFKSVSELKDFLLKMGPVEEKVETKAKENRGSKTIFLHQQAKQLLAENPDKSYKQCLKLAGEKIRNDKK